MAGVVGLCLCAAIEAHAQQRPTTGFGTFGSGGGLGGGGLGGGRSGGSSGTGGNLNGNQYNPNGGVGSAIISMDPDTRNITVIADEATMKSVSQVIESLDKPKPQVLIKVVFLELQHNNASDIGFEGAFTHNIDGTTSGGGAQGFGLSSISSLAGSNNIFGMPISGFSSIAPYSGLGGAGIYQVLSKDFQATLRAIAQAGKAQLLSRPSILARDNQPATIVVGQQVPLPTSVSYTSTGGTAVPIIGVTYTDVGIILKVTPYITSEGMVQMLVAPQTSAIDSTHSQSLGNGVNAPYIDLRSADTVVVTPDAQTVVIGGLMHTEKASTENKIPLLGSIPFLGSLFKRTIKSDEKSELLIFLTPYIVLAPTQLSALSSKERNMIVPPKSESEEMLDRFLDKIPVKPQKPVGKSKPAKPQ